MTMTSVFAPITKSVDQDDGTILVYGKATDGGLDLDDQRCDPQWLSEAMPAWFGTGTGVGGNIRAQHRADSAVGKAIDHEVAEDGHYITARIVDRDAIAKTKAGVFTGFSIGIRRPKIVKSTTAPNGTISGGSICEVSLVDRPANPSCLLTMCKAAKPGMKVNVKDYDAEHNLIKCEELTEKTINVVPNPDAPDFTIVDQLVVPDPEAEVVEKATDVAHLDAPAPGQTCADCGEDGHLGCKSVELDENGQLEFDLEAAKALVAETLIKADDEGADIANAQSAIAIIAKLIAAEATDLASDPGEACDIALLLQAVDALRCFQRREQAEQLNGNDNDAESPVLLLAAESDVDKAKYTAEQKRQMLADGKAFKNPDGEPSYPIADKDDLTKAIHAVGRGSGDHDSIRAYIVRRAKALGASDLIPEDWSGAGGGANKAVETDTVEIEPKTSPEAAEKAVTVETSKAVVEPDPDDGLETALLALLEKVASSDAQKADNPIRARLSALMRAEAEDVLEASTKSTAKSVRALTERMEKVESMAIPGGPALRRTEVEVKSSRKQELTLMAAIEERKASAQGLDTDLRLGYLEKASALRVQANAV